MSKVPAWLEEVTQKWQAGIAHVFVLHGNTDDLVLPGMYVKDVLLASGLVAGREVIISYNRSSGINFPSPAHREKFLEIAELKQQAPSGALAALQQARGQLMTGDVPLPATPGQALPLIERALLAADGDNRPRCSLIVEHAETIFPNADLATMSPEDRSLLVTITRWAREKEFTALGPPVFLLVENLGDLHVNLRRASSRIECVRVPYPGHEERLEFIKALELRNLAEDPEGLAARTAGLKLVHIEDIFLRADLAGTRVTEELVRERKEEIVRSEFADILEIIEPRLGFDDVGGMEQTKEFFRRCIIKPVREGRAARVPMGVLLLGPAGTGKTILAEAVAKESGVNCCSLNVGKLLGSYVGQSERNLERALECIHALAPTIVIVDEIDQSGLSRSNSGDSGVSNRIFRRLLEFMSDTSHRGKIVFLGISNRPDLLDAALKRPGRFDRKVPILTPETDEREAIIRVILRKYGIGHRAGNLKKVAESTDGWTGAELEALVLKAYEIAEDAGEPLSEDHLLAALERYYPSTQDIEAMTALAVAECNDTDLLPPRYKELLKTRNNQTREDQKNARARSRRAL
ncbi:ATP-binding protein [Desulfofundulus sp.]|uniref:ATP-binding protein n=1 Tax=Desulfofundulus sp. TaxID=2282750 RepID=UPI003C74538B